MQPSIEPSIEAFFDSVTCTVSYVVYDRPGGRAAIIDPVLDYDPKAGRTTTASAQRLIRFVQEQELGVDWILETHAHADHLSAAHHLRQLLGGRVAIGDHIRQVQGVFKRLFNLEPGFAEDGSQFDHLFSDGEVFPIGALRAEALLVPGHTPADMAYRIGDAVFVGDTLFMPDVGTARCDFPGGNAHTLYASIRRLLSLPEQTRLYLCHDYPPAGREPAWQTTVAEQRRANIHVHDGVDEARFVAMRTARDATLEMPVLILPAVQVNIRAGALPAPEANGVSYLKIPLNAL
ncbi:MAG: MBL fold metallo-hydrolase [Nevskia sp.]|nr:MBL fold metallo-hydrolase [Nevskia sp.]